MLSPSLEHERINVRLPSSTPYTGLHKRQHTRPAEKLLNAYAYMTYVVRSRGHYNDRIRKTTTGYSRGRLRSCRDRINDNVTTRVCGGTDYILASGFRVLLVVPLQAEYGVDGVVFGRGHDGRGRVRHRPVLRPVERQAERRDGRLVPPDEQLDVGPAVGRHLRRGRHHFAVAVAVRLHGRGGARRANSRTVRRAIRRLRS